METKKTIPENEFSWGNMIDTLTIQNGRKNLGGMVPVAVYRMLEYSLRQAMEEELGKAKAIDILRKAGHLCGEHFAKNALSLDVSLDVFLAELQENFLDMKVGILRVEDFDKTSGEATFTISEDLDCSGLPIIGETVCNYDEGLLAGVLSAYTKKPYNVIEIDCWAKGDRVCRFKASVK